MEGSYVRQILEAYEGEVAGAAYFDALRRCYPERSRFLEECAALERATAERLLPLVHKYGLTPATDALLARVGGRDARAETGREWTAFLRESADAYAGYVAGFLALEAMAPAEDRAVLGHLTAHEVELIRRMRAESGLPGTGGRAPGV
jgi:hypothetical protein